jgi:aerobic carbon-monoxide dehydrogenase medium subunit
LIPPEFDYTVASTVSEAIAALEHREDARVIAGGQSIIPALKARAVGPRLLIDIGRITELRGISVSNDTVEIGPLTTHREIEESEELRHLLPIMAEAANLVADPPVRNRGTLGGSLATADPGGDWPAVTLALGALLEATGPDGTRTISIDDFFIARQATALRHDELLTRITIPLSQRPVRMAYAKLRHPASGYALVGVAVVIDMDEDGVCRNCRAAVTGAGPKATLLQATCDALVGQRLTSAALRAAAAQASVGLSLFSDIYAGEEYRAHLVRVYVERVMRTAMTRAGTGT